MWKLPFALEDKQMLALCLINKLAEKIEGECSNSGLRGFRLTSVAIVWMSLSLVESLEDGKRVVVKD